MITTITATTVIDGSVRRIRFAAEQSIPGSVKYLYAITPDIPDPHQWQGLIDIECNPPVLYAASLTNEQLTILHVDLSRV